MSTDIVELAKVFRHNILSSVSRRKTKHVLKGNIFKPPYAAFQASKPFLQGAESHIKVLNLMIKELVRIVNMNRGSLHTRILGVNSSLFVETDELKVAFSGPEAFRDFRETGPRCVIEILRYERATI